MQPCMFDGMTRDGRGAGQHVQILGAELPVRIGGVDVDQAKRFFARAHQQAPEIIELTGSSSTDEPRSASPALASGTRIAFPSVILPFGRPIG